MDLENVLMQKGKCCISNKPLATSPRLHLVQLACVAEWRFPVWGNLTTGQTDLALAVLHDDFVDGNGRPLDQVRYAIEIHGSEITYHEVSRLVPVQLLTCPHHRKQGDNYGLTCLDCGSVLEGYGYRAHIRSCVHAPHFQKGEPIGHCQYCERPFVNPNY